jgi:hypothetical protein
MAKLHELLAVEGQLKGQAQATRTDLKATLEKKRHLFEKKVVTFHPNEENAQTVTEQQSDLQSTVPKELEWIAGIWSKALDVSFQVAEANRWALADVTLDDGTVLLKQVPATALLELEKRAAEIQELVSAIPTLDPAKGFRPDPDQGNYVYRARDVVKKRTKKVPRVITLAPATEQHPAQAQVINEDAEIGTITEQEWCALLTPAEKGDMLERAEALRRAIKQARQRANDVPLDTTKMPAVGAALFGYVFRNGASGGSRSSSGSNPSQGA